jgi:hypothetical protein
MDEGTVLLQEAGRKKGKRNYERNNNLSWTESNTGGRKSDKVTKEKQQKKQ